MSDSMQVCIACAMRKFLVSDIICENDPKSAVFLARNTEKKNNH